MGASEREREPKSNEKIENIRLLTSNHTLSTTRNNPSPFDAP